MERDVGTGARIGWLVALDVGTGARTVWLVERDVGTGARTDGVENLGGSVRGTNNGFGCQL